MMYSVPDTAFGAALGQFLRLFEQRPLELARLHTAFAALAALAARDHPEMPWPMKLTNDGQTGTFTVEELLASMRTIPVGKPTVNAAAIAEKLVLWHGAKVLDAVGRGGLRPYLRLDFSILVRDGIKKAYSEWLGSLVVSCSWKLRQAQKVLCTSIDTDHQVGRIVLKALKGAKCPTTNLEPDGKLTITFNRHLLLEVRPDDFSIGPDYLLHLSGCIFSHFDGSFTKEEFSFLDENSEPTAGWPTG